MIKAHNFRQALGLTQEETAMVLRISISQLSMFEIGQRDLPVQTMIKLANMYNYVQNKQQEKFEHPVLKKEEARITTMLEKELYENQYQQLTLERKINVFKSKYQKALSTLQLADYLETQLEEVDTYEKELAGIIRCKALKGIEKNGLASQIKLNLKLSALQMHQKELQKELGQLK